MAGKVFVKNGKVEPQRDDIKLSGVHGGYNPHRDGTVKGKQLAAREIEREIADLDNGHVDLDSVLAEPQGPNGNGKHNQVLDRVAKEMAKDEDKALNEEMKRVRKAAGVGNAAFVGMAQDVKNARK